MLTFTNRTALVTGAGRGIGKAIAETLARNGVTVICVSKSAESCGSAAAAITQAGGKARALAVDVSDAAAIAKAAEALLAEIPIIDILVNNAGITRDGLLFRMSDADWNDVISTNLTSCFHWTKHLARPMTHAGQANYSAAKAGMIGLTKSLAREFASRSVTVNAVAPGFIKTDMTTEFVNKPELAAKILEVVPLKRFGEASDIANICAYLCSEEAGYVTGQVFTVDGGMAM
jgi:3-oxoacyl-[acyl-carrier protein] reductase